MGSDSAGRWLALALVLLAACSDEGSGGDVSGPDAGTVLPRDEDEPCPPCPAPRTPERERRPG